MQWYLVVALLFVLSISVFAIQNSQQITMKFLYWDLPSFPLVLVILFSTATGVLVTLLFTITRQVRLNLQVRSLQARVKQLEKKLTETGKPPHNPAPEGEETLK
ncbi:MAG: LapA family protein [Bacillota bacterium]